MILLTVSVGIPCDRQMMLPKVCLMSQKQIPVQLQNKCWRFCLSYIVSQQVAAGSPDFPDNLTATILLHPDFSAYG